MKKHNNTPGKSLSTKQGKDKIKINSNPDWEKLSVNALSVLGNYDYLRITPKTVIPVPVPIIKINDEIISTEGSITAFSGACKSGKSALAGWIIAGAISPDGNLNDPLPGLCVEPNPTGKAVIHFDTEQARHKHKHNLNTILRRANMKENPDYFLSYNIRQLDISEYEKVTSGICEEAFRVFKGIHLIVIDGIGVYIKVVNDPEQSNAIIKYFEGIAMKYATPIIVIVHTNPNSDKERGHLGSQIQRKCESLLMIKQVGDISFIEPKHLKSAGKGKIQQIQFTYDASKGYHVGCGVHVSDASNKDAEKQSMVERIAKEIFAEEVALKDGQAVEMIMRVTKMGESTVKGFLKIMRVHQMILKGDDKLWRLNRDYSV